MLHLILGQSGTGKTEYVLQQVKQAASEGRRVLLLVPEHASFDIERRAARLLNGQQMRSTEILSFPRLAENIFRQCGGLSHRALDDVARIILMRSAVYEVQDALGVYRRQVSYQGFLTAMLEEIAEFKRAGITPERLAELSGQMTSAPLAAKLKDMQLIYAAYQALLERSFHDPLDELALATRLAAEQEWFAEAEVWVDGFDYFSVNEREMLQVILQQAAEVTFAVTADQLNSREDIFIFQKKFLHRLIADANAAAIETAVPVVLQQKHRFTHRDLAILQDTLVDAAAAESLQGGALRLIQAETVYEEMRFAAAEICRLVRDEGLRYSDCAILCRDLDRYEGARILLEDYGIPYYYSKKESLLYAALPLFLCTALEAACGSIRTRDILHIARSAASGLTPEAAGRLENYSYIWSVKGSEWQQPFTNNPEGMSEAPAEDYAEQIAAIEESRKAVMEPLLDLRRSLTCCSGAGFASALYRYVCDTHALEHLSAKMSREEKEQLDREWNCIVDVLDLFSDFFTEKELTAAEYRDLFRLALAQFDLGDVPNTVDHVVLAEADRVRLQSPRAVFVLGVNEGVFPAGGGDRGLFSTRERELMNACGAELPAAGVENALREQFVLYTALSASSEKLYITYACRSLQGETSLVPSVFLTRATERLGLSAEDSAAFPSDFWVVNHRSARSRYAALLSTGGCESKTLQFLLKDLSEEEYLAALRRAAADLPAADISESHARELLGPSINLSPTAIENYYKCPYQYFCDKMLRLRPRQKVEFSPFESGSAIHYVFEQMVKKHGSPNLAKLTAAEMDNEIGFYLKEYIRQMVPDTDAVTARFRYQFDRLRLMLRMILRHMAEELAQSRFVAAATEVKVGRGEEIASPALATEDGTPICLRGSIDRVDLYHAEQQDYLRVIDYKSGSKEFRLEEVYSGLNMQMLIYLYAACGDTNHRFGTPQPAGVLYLPSKLQAIDTAADAEEQDVQAHAAAELKMKGLVLEDEEVLRAMEQDLAGVYIPAQIGKNGTFTQSSKLFSKEQFETLQKLVFDNIVEMGNELQRGHVAPLPIQDGRNDPCSYCKYQALCNNSGPNSRCRNPKREEEHD